MASASYEKFNYLIRPAKQIERKLLLEGLHTLSAEFPIRDYRYVGLGSPFYADFMLFHKYLYIDDMVCIEHGPIRKRMKFNKPFPKIRLRLGEVSEIVPTLDRDVRHIVWLDYDYPLNRSILGDVAGLATVLQPESVLLVTVEADPRVQSPGELPDEMLEDIVEYRRQAFDAEIGRFIPGGVKTTHVTDRQLPALYATVMFNHLHDQLALRSLQFFRIFNFAYADGRQMLSLGGIVGTRDTLRKIQRTGIYELPFVTGSVTPIVISVPPLTARERLWLDQHRTSPKSHFELERRAVTHYRRYYRYYPSYIESLL